MTESQQPPQPQTTSETRSEPPTSRPPEPPLEGGAFGVGEQERKVASDLAEAIRARLHPPDLWTLSWLTPPNVTTQASGGDRPPVLMFSVERPSTPAGGRVFRFSQMVPYVMLRYAAMGPEGVAQNLIDDWYSALRGQGIAVDPVANQ